MTNSDLNYIENLLTTAPILQLGTLTEIANAKLFKVEYELDSTPNIQLLNTLKEQTGLTVRILVPEIEHDFEYTTAIASCYRDDSYEYTSSINDIDSKITFSPIYY